MASRRKRALPPWLSGVTVGKQTKQNGNIAVEKIVCFYLSGVTRKPVFRVSKWV